MFVNLKKTGNSKILRNAGNLRDTGNLRNSVDVKKIYLCVNRYGGTGNLLLSANAGITLSSSLTPTVTNREVIPRLMSYKRA